MKLKRIVKITLLTLLCIAIVAYTAYVVFFMSKPDPELRCTAVELIVHQNPKARFVNDTEIKEMLLKAGIYPEGLLLKDVNTKEIEETIAKNQFVDDVQCYKTQNGKICVEIDQRTPVIYILPNGRDGYFIDSKGIKIPNTNYVDNVVIATGRISQSYASNELADFGNYLQTDEFWNSQIAQISVSIDHKNKPVIEIIPRVGDHVVYLGSIDGYQKKLKRLRTFYEKGLTTVGWNKYARIDLQYDNQIICKKR